MARWAGDETAGEGRSYGGRRAARALSRALARAGGARGLGRARAGDADAVEALLAALRPLLVHAAASLLSGGRVPAEDAAEDVAQATLVQVVAHLADCRAQSSHRFAAWALAIARRAVLDARRDPFGEASPGRTPLAYLAARRAGRRTAADVADAAVDPPTPAPAVLAVTHAALGAYGELGDDLAELVWLRVVAGASWAEISGAFDVTPSAAKRRFQRAQSALRRVTLRRLDALPVELRARALALVRGWEA